MKRGRPIKTKKKRIFVGVRLNSETHEKLKNFAENEEISIAVILRNLIKKIIRKSTLV